MCAKLVKQNKKRAKRSAQYRQNRGQVVDLQRKAQRSRSKRKQQRRNNEANARTAQEQQTENQERDLLKAELAANARRSQAVKTEIIPETITEKVPENEKPEEAQLVSVRGEQKTEGSETHGLEIEEAQRPEQHETRIEEEIPLPLEGKKRHRRGYWVWWAVALASALVLYLGGLWLKDAVKEWRHDNNQGIVSEQPPEGEEKPREEQPTEPAEEPSESAEEIKETPPEEPAEPEQPVVPEEPVVYPGDAGGPKLVALTFDDGPSGLTTPRLLDILQSRGVKATFFVLGTMARKSPDIVRREAAEGHEVASHTPYHNQLTNLSFTQIQGEAAEMNRIFQEILGVNPPFTRPPYGSYNANVSAALGQPLVLWSVDPRDWQDRNASTVCSRVLATTRNGSIILIHDIHTTTVDAVPCIIDNLRAQGYEFATVTELAASRGMTLVNGGVYYSF